MLYSTFIQAMHLNIPAKIAVNKSFRFILQNYNCSICLNMYNNRLIMYSFFSKSILKIYVIDDYKTTGFLHKDSCVYKNPDKNININLFLDKI